MEITFKDRKTARIFNSESNLVRECGVENAKLIKRRLAVLGAALSLDEVAHRPPERRHELAGARKGQFAVDVKQPYRIVFVPNHNPLPVKTDGGIDLRQVTAITILGVEDYH